MAIGPLLTLAAVLTTLGLALNFRAARSALGWVAMTVLLVVATLPIASGFWAPGRIPLSQFIQFPWRLLGPASMTACVALGIGTAAACTRLSETTKSNGAIAVASAILMVIAWPYASAPGVESVRVSPQTIRASMESTTNDNEYLPLVVPSAPSSPAKQLVSSAHGAAVERAESEGSHHELTIDAKQAGASVALALHAFPGWRVKTRSGPGEATLDTSSQGLIRLNFPSPGQYQLTVSHGITPAGVQGTALSALAAVVLGLLLLRGSPWWRAPLPSQPESGGAA